MKIIRFGVVGAINTLVDFAVLNLLLVGFAIQGGVSLLLCNAVSFTVANLNSYVLNKSWTFADRSRRTFRQFLLFLAFSLGGLFVNSLVLLVLTSFSPEIAKGHRLLWINGSKIIATGASMVWNFLAYRHFVFNSNSIGQHGRHSSGPGVSAEDRSSAAADSPLAGSNKR